MHHNTLHQERPLAIEIHTYIYTHTHKDIPYVHTHTSANTQEDTYTPTHNDGKFNIVNTQTHEQTQTQTLARIRMLQPTHTHICMNNETRIHVKNTSGLQSPNVPRHKKDTSTRKGTKRNQRTNARGKKHDIASCKGRGGTTRGKAHITYGKCTTKREPRRRHKRQRNKQKAH